MTYLPYVINLGDKISLGVYLNEKEESRLKQEYKRKLKLKIGFSIWLKFQYSSATDKPALTTTCMG